MAYVPALKRRAIPICLSRRFISEFPKVIKDSGAPQTIPRIARDHPLPVPASLPCNASLSESLNREKPILKLELPVISLVIQGSQNALPSGLDLIERVVAHLTRVPELNIVLGDLSLNNW